MPRLIAAVEDFGRILGAFMVSSTFSQLTFSSFDPLAHEVSFHLNSKVESVEESVEKELRSP